MNRIGFDAKRLFNNFTGLGNYSRTLVKNLMYYHPEYECFLYTPSVQKNQDTQSFLNNPSYSIQTPGRFEKTGWRSYRVRHQLSRHKIDLYHGLSNEIPLGLKRKPFPVIVTIHDLIYKHFPKQYPSSDRFFYDQKTRYACKNSDLVVAISTSTKQDLIQFYQVPEEKIKVIYQSCAEHFFQEKSEALIEKITQKYQLPSEYMLYVGSITERKNLLNIIKAMKLLPKDMDLPFVIVGGGKGYKQTVLEYIHEHQLEQYIHFIQPDNEDLPFIYQKAELFLYPSLFEGFGIPIIEALFSKTPVITSNCSSMPEAGGPDSFLINPTDPGEIAYAIDKTLSDSKFRDQMVEKGYTYAQRFKGEVLTEKLVSVYDQLL